MQQCRRKKNIRICMHLVDPDKPNVNLIPPAQRRTGKPTRSNAIVPKPWSHSSWVSHLRDHRQFIESFKHARDCHLVVVLGGVLVRYVTEHSPSDQSDSLRNCPVTWSDYGFVASPSWPLWLCSSPAIRQRQYYAALRDGVHWTSCANQMEKPLGSTSIRHRSDTKCRIDA